MELVFYGNPVFKEKAKPVTDFSGMPEHCYSMLVALREAPGIGLASQHLGRNEAICVIDLESKDDSVLFLINPKITEYSQETEVADEGSISFPGINGPIERSTSITVEYQDVSGNSHTLQCSELLARCIQHEVDQMNGIIYIERMDPRYRLGLRAKLKKLKRANK